MKPTGMYLPHLDGLRAVALFGVLAFHFRVPYCQGGYVGVDVFFVLSGYLMTRKIYCAYVEDRFSIREFYVSRAWRLMPAAHATCLICLFCAWLILPPPLARRTALSALSATGFSSNIFFWATGDYFDVSSEFKPLLHTWSLSVEEQFYLFYPPCLLSVMRAQRRPVIPLLILSAVSFISCTVLERVNPSFAFYGLPCRVFEFGFGALATFAERKVDVLSPQHINIAAFLGTGAIFGSYFLLDSTSRVSHSILAVLGTVAVILAPNSCLKIMYNNSIFRYAGKISYSAYLWHWPLYVFLKYFAGAVPEAVSFTHPAALVFVTFAGAVPLYRCCEVPFRAKRRTWKSLLAIVIMGAAVLAVALTSLTSNGWEGRMAVRPLGYNTFRTAPKILCSSILLPWRRNDTGGEPCVLLPTKYNQTFDVKQARVLLVGNSYATHLAHGFQKLATESGRPVMMSAIEACPFTALEGDIPSHHKLLAEIAVTENCIKRNQARWTTVERMVPNSTIVVGDTLAGWHLLSGALIGNETFPESALPRVLKLAEKISTLGMQPVFIGSPPLPAFATSVVACADFLELPISRFLSHSKCSNVTILNADTRSTDLLLDEYSRKTGKFTYISIVSHTCYSTGLATMCSIFVPGTTKYIMDRDMIHLSKAGSNYVFELMRNKAGFF
jgi:peptidoglycan/LPS O-acetylase OafA/YrhL